MQEPPPVQVCGEVRRLSDDETELVIDVSELTWEPIEA